jgi:hypothetical protein
LLDSSHQIVSDPVTMPNSEAAAVGTSRKHGVKSYVTRERGPQPSGLVQKGCRTTDERVAAMTFLGREEVRAAVFVLQHKTA